MPVQYPTYLPMPQQDGYSRTESPQFEESELQAGPPIRQRNTFDTPATYALNFQFDEGQAVAFRAWFVSQTDYGMKPFTITVLNDGELVEQEVSFTRDGIAQITGTSAKTTTYRAQVRARKIKSAYSEDDYADIIQLAEMSPDGSWLTSANLFDVIVNETLPMVEA